MATFGADDRDCGDMSLPLTAWRDRRNYIHSWSWRRSIHARAWFDHHRVTGDWWAQDDIDHAFMQMLPMYSTV
jgi:hypothetical protein